MKNTLPNRKSRNCSVLFLCFVFTQSMFGQLDFHEGYVIKNNNDTIYGLLKLQERAQNGRECIFMKDPDSELVKYLPSEILGYRFINGKYYVSKTVSYHINSETTNKIDHVVFDRMNDTFYSNDSIQAEIKPENDGQQVLIRKLVFLEFLIKGNLDVYLYFDNKTTPLYFIKKDNDSLIHLKNTTGVISNQWNDDYSIEKKEYIGILNYFLNDCEGIQSKVAGVNLTNESLIKIAKYYHDNTCSNTSETCIIFEKPNRKVHLSVVPLIGYSKLNVAASGFNTTLDSDFTNQKRVAYGLNLKFSNFQYFNQHLSTQVGIMFHHQKFESEDISTTFEFNVLEIPVEIDYSFFLNSKVNPFLGLSVNPYYRVNRDFGTSLYAPYLMSETNKFYLAFSGCAGIEYNINKKLFFTAALQYKLGGAFYKKGNSRDNSKSEALAFRLGFGYLLTRD